MTVTVAKHAGFCKGVKSAVEKALSLAKERGKIYTLGELVHNELVTEYLQSNGVDCINPDQIDELEKGTTVLIRAHGVPPEIESRLIEKGLIVEDATCPVVKKNQLLAKERRELGGEIIIVGDESHDEVKGLLGYCGENAKVVRDPNPDDFQGKNVSILFQTTVTEQKFKKISEIVENFQKNGNKTLVVFNTICYNTVVRQNEVRALAENSDAILILGSRTSANTKRLFEAAKEVNGNVFFAETADEVRSYASKLKDFQNVSIAAGASTPPWLIWEVNKLMSETQNNTANAAETEVKQEATLQEQKVADSKEPSTMAELMGQAKAEKAYVFYKPGKVIECTVINAVENGIYVGIGGKKDGLIEKAEVSVDGNYNPADFKAGDTFKASILSVGKDFVLLSKKSVDIRNAEEQEAEKALAAGEFSLKMTEVTKGGLRGKLGSYTIFVPASQIKIGFVKNLEDYKDKTLRLVLLPDKQKAPEEPKAENAENAENAEVAEPVENNEAAENVEAKPKKRSRYLFASQRVILEREKKEKEDKFWDNIHVNDIVTGKVKRFTQFGAFVNVDGFDCLAHISELSWNRINDPSTVLTIGDVKDFVVLKLDREHGRISLGYKQLQKKPYEIAAEKYPVGTVVKGKVERIFPYGAFVSLEDGIDGLVHVSQISHNWIKDANEALTVGQEVEAKIIGFEDTRITLSIKDLLPAPEENANAEVADAEASEEEKASKRSSRVKKFEQKVADGEGRKERRAPKKENSDEPKQWVSGNSSASLGDLIKGLNLELADEEEEAPKKTTRKKKTDDAE